MWVASMLQMPRWVFCLELWLLENILDIVVCSFKRRHCSVVNFSSCFKFTNGAFCYLLQTNETIDWTVDTFSQMSTHLASVFVFLWSWFLVRAFIQGISRVSRDNLSSEPPQIQTLESVDVDGNPTPPKRRRKCKSLTRCVIFSQWITVY